MYAIGYDCLGSKLFKVHAKTENRIKELLNVYWDSDTTIVIVYKNNGNKIHILYDFLHGGFI